MAKLLTLKESELITMVKTIVEQVNIDLSQYDDNDFTDAFIFLFRTWISNKLGEESKKYPFSFLLKKYAQEFIKESFGDKYTKYFGDDDDVNIGRHMIPRIGKYLIQSGIHSLPSLRGEEKFTEKYARHLPRLIKLLEIPSWVKIQIKEDRPNEVVVNLIVDYPSYLKSEPSSYLHEYSLQKKLQTIIEDYLGVDFGNPVHGELNLSLRIMSENEESWIKNVLNKEIKKHIKAMPDGNNVHSIRFEPKATGNSDMKIVYKDNSYRHMHQYDFRNKVRDYLKGLGYNKINVENI